MRLRTEEYPRIREHLLPSPTLLFLTICSYWRRTDWSCDMQSLLSLKDGCRIDDYADWPSLLVAPRADILIAIAVAGSHFLTKPSRGQRKRLFVDRHRSRGLESSGFAVHGAGGNVTRYGRGALALRLYASQFCYYRFCC